MCVALVFLFGSCDPNFGHEPLSPTTSENGNEGGSTSNANLRTTPYGSKSANQEKAVGDIIFVDGSAEPYSEDLVLDDEQKEAAIAVVFYTGLFRDRLGLGNIAVGLKETALEWSAIDAYGITGNSNVIDSDCGKNNMDAIQSYNDYKSDAKNKYPAFYWTANYSKAERVLSGSAFENDWYIPAENELDELYEQRQIVCKVLEKLEGTPLKTGDDCQYWTSTVDSSRGYPSVRLIRFSNGDAGYASHSKKKYNVRPIRHFAANIPLEQTQNTHTVTFDSAGGSEVSVQYVVHGEKLVLPEITVKSNQAFKGWFLDDEEFNIEETEITQDITLTAKWWLGTKKPTDEKSVNDIIFSDGSLLPYVEGLSLNNEQRTSAIAVIFLRSNAWGAVGVGLKQNRTGLPWCSANAAAYNKELNALSNRWTSNLVGNDFPITMGNLLGNSNDTSDTQKYPLFHWAKNYKNQEGSRVKNTVFEDGWYLPQDNELNKIIHNSTISKALSACGGDRFDDYPDQAYWCANPAYYETDEYIVVVGGEHYIMDALFWTVNLDKNQLADKTSLNWGCAVRAFN